MEETHSESEEEKKIDESIEQALNQLAKLESSAEDTGSQQYLQGKAGLYAEIGILYLKKNVFQKSRDYLMAALRDFIKLEDKIAIASTQGSIGSLYLTAGDYLTAKQYYSDAYQFWQDAPHLNERIATLNSLGICELNLGNEQEGVDRVLKAMSIAAKLHADADFLFSIEILLRYYEEKKNYDVLRELKYKALEYWSKEDRFIVRKFKTLIDIGVLSQILDEFQEALRAFKQAFNIALDLGDFQRAYLAQGFIAETYVSLEEIEKAKETYLSAYKIAMLIDLDSDLDSTNESEQMKIALMALGVPMDVIEKKKVEALEERKRIRKEIEDAKKKESDN